MKLTPKEKEICKEYSRRREDGKVRCYECPLNLTTSSWNYGICYKTIDGRTAEAKQLERLYE